VRRAEARVNAEKGIELFEQLTAKLKKMRIGGQRHFTWMPDEAKRFAIFAGS
jgi:hypothetical protein